MEISSLQNDLNSYEEAEEFLSSIPQFLDDSHDTADFGSGIERARLLLEYAGHPEKDLNVIHVAGSNAKGSVCALLDCALQSAGYKTGLFTSPHLTDIRERIKLSGEMIAKDLFLEKLNEVCRTVKRVKERFPGFQPAYFEFFFLAAVLFFKEQGAEIVILETGLGGRLDATNACERPKLCIITPVSKEHSDILGDTIKQIASEKAGIIKERVPVVVTGENKEAVEVFRIKAEILKSPFYVFDEKEISVNRVTHENIDFSLHSMYYGNVTVSLPIPAIYEAENASLALTALDVLASEESIKGFDRDFLGKTLPCIIRAFASFRWPGRMDRIQEGVYIDGAHNAAGIKAFLQSVASFACDKKNVLLFAVSDNKDKKEMARLICESGLFSVIVITAFSGARSSDAEETEKVFRAMGAGNTVIAKTVPEAFDKALSIHHDNIFCTGSLFLAGEIIAGLA